MRTDIKDKVWFSSLSSGRETEFKIFLKPENDKTSDEAFKKVFFDNGVVSYEGQLECGDQFVQKNVLLVLTAENTINAKFLDIIHQQVEQKLLPRNLLLRFGEQFPLTLFPTLYCREQGVFITIRSNDREYEWQELLEQIKQSQNSADYFCVACEHNKECFNQQSLWEQRLGYFAPQPTGLYLLAYFPLKLIEISQLIACSNEASYSGFFEALADEAPWRLPVLERVRYNPTGQLDASKLLIKKLKIISKVLDFVLTEVAHGRDIVHNFHHDNLYVDGLTTKDEVATIALYPTRETDQNPENYWREATVRVVKENTEINFEFRQALSDDTLLAVGDELELIMTKNPNPVICRLENIENDFCVLSIAQNDSDHLKDTFVTLKTDIFNSIKYRKLKDFHHLSVKLFDCVINLLLRNSNLNDEDMHHVKNLLTPLINNDNSVTASDVAEFINTHSALAVVLRQENLFYQPTTELSNKVSNYHWLNVLSWMCQFLIPCPSVSTDEFKNQLESLNHQLSELLIDIEQHYQGANSEITDENYLIKKALSELLGDEEWLNEVMQLSKPRTHKHSSDEGSLEETFSETRVLETQGHPEQQHDSDHTLIFPAKK